MQCSGQIESLLQARDLLVRSGVSRLDDGKDFRDVVDTSSQSFFRRPVIALSMSSSAIILPKRESSTRRSKDGPETDVLDAPLTPPRARKGVKSVSPARGRGDEDRVTSIHIKDEKSLSPKKSKSTRSYDAPSSPGKSPTRGRSSAAIVRSDSTDEDEEEAKVTTPVSSPGRSKKVEEAALVSPSPATGLTRLALHSPANKIKVGARAQKAYSIIRNCTGTLGGNGTTGAIYGELTMGSMQKIINLMVEQCELDNQSRFIDVGSGLGKPNFHAAQDPQCRLSVGVELEDIRWHLSMYNLKHTLTDTTRGKPMGQLDGDDDKEDPLLSGVNFMVGDIDNAASTDPFTHIYMYDLGFPPSLQKNIAKKFNNSQYAQYLVSYRPPRRVIEEYGYAVDFITQMTTSMHGSGEGHMAYFYKRNNAVPKISTEARSNLKKVNFPRRPGFDEKSVDILCDTSFEECVKLAVGDIAPLLEHATEIVGTHLLSSTRPVRDRKPRRLFEA